MYLQLEGMNYLLKQIIFGLILLCKYKRYRYKYYCEKKCKPFNIFINNCEL